MTILRLAFAGKIQKAESDNIAGKSVIKCSLCKNRKDKNGNDDWTWINITIWQPADWMIPKLVKGAFIAGSGEFCLRSYESNGEKKQSADVRCTSFDVDIAEAGAPLAQAGKPQRPAAQADDDRVPF